MSLHHFTFRSPTTFHKSTTLPVFLPRRAALASSSHTVKSWSCVLPEGELFWIHFLFYKTEERNTKLGYTQCPLAACFVTRRRTLLTNYPWTEQYGSSEARSSETGKLIYKESRPRVLGKRGYTEKFWTSTNFSCLPTALFNSTRTLLNQHFSVSLSSVVDPLRERSRVVECPIKLTQNW